MSHFTSGNKSEAQTANDPDNPAIEKTPADAVEARDCMGKQEPGSERCLQCPQAAECHQTQLERLRAAAISTISAMPADAAREGRLDPRNDSKSPKFVNPFDPNRHEGAWERKIRAHHEHRVLGKPIPAGVGMLTRADEIVGELSPADFVVEGVVADEIAKKSDNLIHRGGSWYVYLGDEKGIFRQNNTAGKLEVDAVAKVMAQCLQEEIAKINATAPKGDDEAKQDKSMQAARALKTQRKNVLSRAFSDNVDALLRVKKTRLDDDDPFDQDRDAICVSNGYIRWEDGKIVMRPHSPDMRFTRQMNVAYDEKADCPGFMKFMDEISDGQLGWVEYLLGRLAEAMFGHIRREEVYFLQGAGANGKSVLNRIISYLLGSYAYSIRTECLTTKVTDNAAADAIAQAAGARLVWGNEISSGLMWNEGMLKTLSSSDKANARFLRYSNFQFSPQWHLFISANARPVLKDTSVAMQRRMRLIEFTANFLIKPDLHLAEKLIAETSGIFNLLLRTYADVAANDWRVELPKCIADSSAEYIAENDWLRTFLEDETEAAADSYVTLDILFERFQAWAKKINKWTHVSRDTLAREMKAKGYELRRVRPKGASRDVKRPYAFTNIRLVDSTADWKTSYELIPEDDSAPAVEAAEAPADPVQDDEALLLQIALKIWGSNMDNPQMTEADYIKHELRGIYPVERIEAAISHGIRHKYLATECIQHGPEKGTYHKPTSKCVDEVVRLYECNARGDTCK